MSSGLLAAIFDRSVVDLNAALLPPAIGKKGEVTLPVELPLVEGDGGQWGSGLFEGRGLAPSGLEDLKALLTQIGQQDHYQAVLGM